MNDSPPPTRPIFPAMGRGAIGRCPACGKGALLRGFINPAAQCDACGEQLGQYQSADFAAYFVMFLVGAIFTPMTLILAFKSEESPYAIWFILGGAVATALLLLPRAKGAVIGLLWALRIHNV
ncbi:MAG: DUF983 domain-containing protein [Hyphomonadaceae bacterium]|nr:DUF983 domain-containing protein [Hyphomonadaceae bacterium]